MGEKKERQPSTSLGQEELKLCREIAALLSEIADQELRMSWTRMQVENLLQQLPAENAATVPRILEYAKRKRAASTHGSAVKKHPQSA